MAHKSKTQRAKASAVRAAKKEQLANEVEVEETEVVEEPKKGFFEAQREKRAQRKELLAEVKKDDKEKKAKKNRFKFLKEVSLEMKRVTWPSKQDVLRWSGVVAVALLFFGVYVAVLDNLIVTPLLYALAGLGA